MSDNGREVIPVKKRQPYPNDAVTLALAVIQNGGSIRQACKAVGEQFGRRPDTHTVHNWTQDNAEAFAKLQPAERRKWQILVGQVLELWANRAKEAATARKADGSYVVPHSQVMVPYGIAKDAVKGIEDTVNPRGTGQMVNVQFNLVTVGDPPEETIEGEAREVPKDS